MRKTLLDLLNTNEVYFTLNIYDSGNNVVKYRLDGFKKIQLGKSDNYPEQLESVEMLVDRNNLTSESEEANIKMLIEVIIDKINKR